MPKASFAIHAAFGPLTEDSNNDGIPDLWCLTYQLDPYAEPGEPDHGLSRHGNYSVWEAYVVGFDNPKNPDNCFYADIAFVTGKPVITPNPDRRDHWSPRFYKLLAKPSLDAVDWVEVDLDEIPVEMRFFKIKVDVK